MTGPKSVVGARSVPAGSLVKAPSGESQSRKMSARATTTRALAPLEAVTVKVFPAWLKPVTLPAVAVAPAGAAAAGEATGPAAARPATARAAASRAARVRRSRGGVAVLLMALARVLVLVLRMPGSLMGQLLVRSGSRTHRFGMHLAR